MASIINDPNGRKRISFKAADGFRKSIRLGKMSKRDAEFIKFKVEKLVSSSITGHAVDDETSRWLTTLENELADKLVSVGLIKEQNRYSLGNLLDTYLNNRQDVKEGTLINWGHTIRNLLSFFGSLKNLKKHHGWRW